MTKASRTAICIALCFLIARSFVTRAQRGAVNGEWRSYGGDAAGTKYSPLDQINAANVSQLQIAWRWKRDGFGSRPDSNWQVTPLMAGGGLYFTAGTSRAAVAVDAASGDTLWTCLMDEGTRGAQAPRTNNRGLAYWSNGTDDARILMITPGYQLVALNAKSGKPIPDFGENGVVDLWNGLDRQVEPSQIGSSSPPMVVGDVVIIGAALQGGTAPRSKTNVPGYVRGYD